jgi:hypothetical protein
MRWPTDEAQPVNTTWPAALDTIAPTRDSKLLPSAARVICCSSSWVPLRTPSVNRKASVVAANERPPTRRQMPCPEPRAAGLMLPSEVSTVPAKSNVASAGNGWPRGAQVAQLRSVICTRQVPSRVAPEPVGAPSCAAAPKLVASPTRSIVFIMLFMALLLDGRRGIPPVPWW